MCVLGGREERVVIHFNLPLHLPVFEKKTSQRAYFLNSMNEQFVDLVHFTKIRLKKQRIVIIFFYCIPIVDV